MRNHLLKDLGWIKKYPSQKRLVRLCVLIILLAVCFVFLVYLPNKSRTISLMHDLMESRMHVQQLQALVGVRNIRPEVRLIKDEYERVQQKFPSNEEESLRLLPDYAQKMNIDILSLKRQPRVSYLDGAGAPVMFQGYSVETSLISLEMRGLYKDLLQFLRTLDESLPGFLYADRITINKDREGSLKLTIGLDFRSFLLTDTSGHGQSVP